MFVRKSLPETEILLHRETVEKHGSHNQASHGRRGGGGSGGASSGDRQPNVGRLASRGESIQNRLENVQWKEDLDYKDSNIYSDVLGEIKSGVRYLSSAKGKEKIAANKLLGQAKDNLLRARDRLLLADSGRLVRIGDSVDSLIDSISTMTKAEKSEMFLYKTAVSKHGSHNQKTHAGSRGKGGGAGGGGSSKPTAGTSDANPDTNPKLSDTIDKEALIIIEDIDELSTAVTEQAMRAKTMVEAKRLSRAEGDLQVARSALMPLPGIKNNGEKIRKINRAADKLSSASKIVGMTSQKSLSSTLNELSMDASDVAIGLMAKYVELTQKYGA